MMQQTYKVTNQSNDENQSNDCLDQCTFHRGRHNVYVCKQLDGSKILDIQCTQV